MAVVDTGPAHGGKRPVDASIPLVPFIDFLLCCVMFLLVTAVWNQLARLPVTRHDELPGCGGMSSDEDDASRTATLLVGRAGFELRIGNDAAQPLSAASLRDGSLVRAFAGLREVPLVVHAVDGVRFEDIVAVLDLAASAGLDDVQLSPLSQ